MSMKWLTTMKPSFQIEWLALPQKESRQVLEKISLLTQDPFPDGKVKKQLVHIDPKLHRIRSGDYRIFYTFEKPYISLLALRRRKEDTYDEEIDSELLGGLEPEFDVDYDAIPPTLEGIPAVPITSSYSYSPFSVAPVQIKKALPEPVTTELLTNLLIPQEYYAPLLAATTEDDLLECPASGVPNVHVGKVLEYMFPRSIAERQQEPDLVLQDKEDLLRFKDGRLTSFLLKLSSEQEKIAEWSTNATGPTQVKGNPGTGKSTVALYRVQSILQKLEKVGGAKPSVLYTTYTNALVTSSGQLLQELLAGDMRDRVVVKTADKLVREILSEDVKSSRETVRIAEDGAVTGALKRAIQRFQQQGAQQAGIEHIGFDYLLEEICQFIIPREIVTREAYLSGHRQGRKLRLTETQKKAVWEVYELFLRQLETAHLYTWQQARLKAEKIVLHNPNIQRYDAVIVDEAQDLDPAVLRILVCLCKSMNRFFITADANQSIYKSAFSWSDVHENLKFTGRRTTVLTTNYRSTRQISEAAQSYLANGALETEPVESVHMYRGPLPYICVVQDSNEEMQVLATFLPGAARECRLLMSSCAVLCPTWEAGKRIEDELKSLGVEARFMARQEVNLEYSGVKILTLHSSKGLEFPVVAIAGLDSTRYAKTFEHQIDDGKEELLERDRRTLFVGMTRSMRTLLVIVPEQAKSPLLEGFDPVYWNIRKITDLAVI